MSAAIKVDNVSMVFNLSSEKIDSIKARVMVDTALGTSDYAYYMLAQPDGSYRQIEEETTVKGSDYYNYFLHN